MHSLPRSFRYLSGLFFALLIAGFSCSSEPGTDGFDAGEPELDAGGDTGQDAEPQSDTDSELDADSEPPDATSSDTGEDVTSDVEPDAGNEPDPDTGDASGPDAGSDAGDPDAGPDTGEPDAAPACAPVTDADSYDCESGHSELDDDGVLRLHPEEIDAGGCELFTDHDTFRHFDEMSWTVQACPGETQTFQLLLDDCYEEAYTAYLSIEPIDPECSLDEYADLEFSPQSGPTDMSCEALERTTYCYYEDAHDEGGGFDWTLRTREESTTDPAPWYIQLDVEVEWNAHFEYEVTAHIPPLSE